MEKDYKIYIDFKVITTDYLKGAKVMYTADSPYSFGDVCALESNTCAMSETDAT